MTQKTTLLIDGDIFAYQAASRGQETFAFADEEHGNLTSVKLQDLSAVTTKIKEDIAEITERLKPDNVVVCLSCATADCWRKDVLPSYKGNRKDVAKPEHLAAAKYFMRATWRTYEKPRLEADDVMGILSTHPTLIEGRKIIVSIDKDMQSIPGWLFNPSKDKKAQLVDQRDADLYHLYQTITGDSTDGYKGCPSVGPKGAATALAQFHATYGTPEAVSGWDAVVATYESKGLGEPEALVQARVARICRHTDYDYKRKEVKLWTPH